MGRLFWKFFFASWLVQALAVLALSTGVWFKDRNLARRNARVNLGPQAAFAVDAAAQTLRFGGLPALRALLQEHNGMAVYAIDDDDRELLERATTPALLHQLRQLHERDPGTHALQDVQADGHHWLLFAARQPRAANGAREYGYGNNTFGQRGHRPPHDNYFPVIPMLLAMLGSLLSAALLAWHFAKPIRRLRQAFDDVAAGKLDTRIGHTGKRGDELTDLGRDFDRMAHRLESVLQAQRRLLHDVSHEMRSPLARLQAAIGLARQRPDRVDTWLDRIEHESTRMDGMIGEVLALARLDSGADPASQDEISLDELAAQVADDACFEAQASGKSVTLQSDGPVTVRGNAELLHSAIENVVRNAVKHTAEGSEVTVQVAVDPAARLATVTVCDHGPGVPEAELELIFRAFQRGSQNGNLPGHGLGLAIAERVVRSHGGVITARNGVGGGLCVEIVLPL